MSSKKAMSRRAIVKEISEVTQVKPSVVRSVLDAFADIFIRETVLTGKFNFSNCFSVDTHERKARKQYNVNTSKYIDYPETKVLSIKLSPKINSFNRWKQRHENNAKSGLTIKDWQNKKK